MRRVLMVKSPQIPVDVLVQEKLGTLLALEHACHDAMSPLQRMEHEMHHWVIFGVMPIFALANAGIALDLHELTTAVSHPVTLGIALGVLSGAAMGWILIHVVNRQSFGWTIRTDVPWLFLAGALALVLLATLAAAGRPARLAAATDAAAVLKEE